MKFSWRLLLIERPRQVIDDLESMSATPPPDVDDFAVDDRRAQDREGRERRRKPRPTMDEEMKKNCSIAFERII
jgi:hypothetical protein